MRPQTSYVRTLDVKVANMVVMIHCVQRRMWLSFVVQTMP